MQRADGGPQAIVARLLAVEMPVAIEIDGIGYVVTVTTPADLDDFAIGLGTGQLLAIDRRETPRGVLLRLAL